MTIDPSAQLGEPDYRYYNCNLQAPKIKCRELIVDEWNSSSTGQGRILITSGYKSWNTTHTFTSADISSLAQNNCAGELTCYNYDPAGNSANVFMAIIVKTAGTFSIVEYYQRLGTFTAMDIANSGTNAVVISCSPGCECRWVWRGF